MAKRKLIHEYVNFAFQTILLSGGNENPAFSVTQGCSKSFSLMCLGSERPSPPLPLKRDFTMFHVPHLKIEENPNDLKLTFYFRNWEDCPVEELLKSLVLCCKMEQLFLSDNITFS